MTNERMALLELIEKGADADLIRELYQIRLINSGHWLGRP